jgi:hypothetical protein
MRIPHEKHLYCIMPESTYYTHRKEKEEARESMDIHQAHIKRVRDKYYSLSTV